MKNSIYDGKVIKDHDNVTLMRIFEGELWFIEIAFAEAETLKDFIQWFYYLAAHKVVTRDMLLSFARIVNNENNFNLFLDSESIPKKVGARDKENIVELMKDVIKKERDIYKKNLSQDEALNMIIDSGILDYIQHLNGNKSIDKRMLRQFINIALFNIEEAAE